MPTITVQLDTTAALAHELALLAASLADEQPLCTAAGAALGTALDGEVGRLAARSAGGWAELLGVLSERCAVTGRVLAEAVAEYREADGALAADVAAASRLRQGAR
jgi:hypothetical protein